MSEDNAIGLLEEMAKKRVLVEICLTSNDMILGVTGDRHPLPIYMKYGVPVALATDDQGVARGDMTHEYLRAVETYNLSYGELKQMARASLEHSFIPGASLWTEGREFRRAAACEGENSAGDHVSNKCGEWLEANERARVQWQLEKAFAEFEKTF
jgi:adenosine deaminase